VTAATETRRRSRPRLPGAVSHVASGIGAVGVKELRGRMRGRRAFVVLTVYLALLGVFAWMVELFLERQYSQSFGGFTYASAEIGRGVFVALLLLQTLLVALLAPAFTAGAISQEREKQTLDLLAATPISSLAIVLGKLLSALTYVFLLILASLPLTALVFVFGGVAPDDVVRGYVVLLVTAVGFGALGLFFSALVRRTQAATVLSYVVVLALTLGSFLLWGFWVAMAGPVASAPVRDLGGGVQAQARSAPEALLWLNPFVAQADVICGTEASFGSSCSIVSEITGRSVVFGGGTLGPVPQPAPGQILIPPEGGMIDGAGNLVVVADVKGQPRQAEQALDDVVANQPDAFGVLRDAIWPRFAASWLVVSIILVLLSVQLVTPTRRWHLRRGGRDPSPGRAA
jgi:ABC-type transport system involved in multi-copper enzyme maturation permease subunit